MVDVTANISGSLTRYSRQFVKVLYPKPAHFWARALHLSETHVTAFNIKVGNSPNLDLSTDKFLAIELPSFFNNGYFTSDYQ